MSTGFDMDVATLPTSPTTIAATPSQNAHRTSHAAPGVPATTYAAPATVRVRSPDSEGPPAARSYSPDLRLLAP